MVTPDQLAMMGNPRMDYICAVGWLSLTIRIALFRCYLAEFLISLSLSSMRLTPSSVISQTTEEQTFIKIGERILICMDRHGKRVTTLDLAIKVTLSSMGQISEFQTDLTLWETTRGGSPPPRPPSPP